MALLHFPGPFEEASMTPPRRQQLHLALPYKFEPQSHPRVAAMLASGWRIVEVTRVTDRETLVTFERAA
jgi:hypothetical protein